MSTPAPVHDPISLLSDRFRSAIRAAFPSLEGEIDPLITASKQAALGDFQSNAAMAIGKRVGKPPREVAAQIVRHADISGIAEKLTDASIAGPGFINIRLRGDALSSMLESMDNPTLGVPPPETRWTIVVDLFGVNLAKQMHVGHLRSPVIGDALARTFERLGHKVIRQNHVGDWGLPIAMVTARLMRLAAAGKINLDRITLDDLDENYKAAQAECVRDAEGLAAVRRFGLGPKAEAELEEQVAGATETFLAARETLLRLQAKEPSTFAVWKKIADVTMAVCIATAKRLHINVTERDSAGESTYADELPGMVEDLVKRGIAEASEGALVIRLEEPEYGSIKEPCLVRKSDGGFLYATTDIAAVRRRVQKLGADRIVYAIDARQQLHLRQFFGASRKAGYARNPLTGKDAILEHAAFGAVLGDDGRPFKTRSGENVNLQSLIDEAVHRAGAAVKLRSPELSDSQARDAGEAIGVTAMKYADLCNDRIKDYVFNFDRMLAFEGNTGPYLLYALVRIKSIFRKSAERGAGDSWKSARISIREPAEKNLALSLLRYPASIRSVADGLEPHRLCGYLYDLASAFSAFFDQCPVLGAQDAATRDARLKLCDLARRVLEDGLGVLGLPTVEKM